MGRTLFEPEGLRVLALWVGIDLQACLATDYLMEVSRLSSRGNRCIPYPPRYSEAFAFSIIL